MRRPLRILRNTFAVCSALLLIATATFWLRGHFRSDYIYIHRPDRVVVINNRPGGISLWGQYLPTNEPGIYCSSSRIDDDYDRLPAQHCGFAYEAPQRGVPRCGYWLGGLRIPHYAITAIALILPTLSMLTMTKSMRHRRLG